MRRIAAAPGAREVGYIAAVRWWVSLVCALAGCVQDEPSTSTLPAGVDRLAKLAFALEARDGVADGGLTLAVTESHSTGLVAVEPGAPLVATVTDELAWFAVGYRASDLASLPLPEDPQVLAQSPLHRASVACGVLPPPAWTAPLNARAEPYDTTFAQVWLRTEWSRSCPQTPAAWLDVRCPDAPACGTNPHFEGCGLSYDADECDDHALAFERVYDGTSCYASTTGCTAEPNGEGGQRWTCPRCEIDTYAPRARQTVAPDVDMHVAVAMDAAAIAAQSTLWPTPRDLERGSVAAMSVRDGTLWVAPRLDPRTFSGLCAPATALERGVVHVYDAATIRSGVGLVPTASAASTGRCYTRLAPDPHGAGMLATYYVDGRLHVGRLDARGRTVAETRLPRGATPLAVSAMTAWLVVSDELVMVAEALELTGDAIVGEYHALDARTLAPVVSRPLELPIKGLAPVLPNGDEVDVLYTGGVRRLDARTGDERLAGAFTKVGILGLNVALARSPLALPAGQLLLPDTRLSAGVALFSVRQGRLAPVSISRIPGETAVVVQPVAIPGRRDVLALALTPGDAARRLAPALAPALAWIELEPERARVRPGLWVVTSTMSDGPPSVLTQPIVDTRGRLWVLAPWEGRVLRFDTLP